MLILHGDNVVVSRQVLQEKVKQAKNKDKEVIRLDGPKLALSELQQALESKSLFGKERLVIIENLLSAPSSKTKESLIDYLKKNSFANLVLWEGKEIKKPPKFKKVEIRRFCLPVAIFKFLDSLAPGERQRSLSLFHAYLNQGSAEMAFYMLARQVRLLLIAKDLGEKGLDKMANWQKEKLIRQAEKFDLDRLLWLHQKLLETDYQQKTGRAPMPLASQLDLLIASL